MKNNVYRNSEGYYDRTAGAAIASLDRKTRSDRRKAIRKANAKAWKQDALEAAADVSNNSEEIPEGGGCE